MHVHLDPVGGLAGDMFAAAILDAFPERAEPLAAALAESRLHEVVVVRTEPFTDGVLRGLRFHTAPAFAAAVSEEAVHDREHALHPHPGQGRRHAHGGDGSRRHGPERPHGSASGAKHGARGAPDDQDQDQDHDPRHPARGAARDPAAAEKRPALRASLGGHSDPRRGNRHEGEGSRHHPHRRFADVRAWLGGSRLPRPVAERAVAIFTLLAEAEAEVHGIPVEDVTFHEVGAWDSIADVVCAAWLIDSLTPATWSCAPLPLGGGRVRTAHGMLPTPAPATALLLRGFPAFHDGVGGERVTPTGAAILRRLDPTFEPAGLGGRIARTGHGFGSRRLPGLSNVLRALVLDPAFDAAFEPAGGSSAWREETIGVCSFEVDDQTAEDLAVGLDRLRAADGVLDVVQTPSFGKKGRMAASVRVLARPEACKRVIERCFAETATLGVRWHKVRRAALEREEAVADVAGEAVRIKRAHRAGGEVTVKAEMDDVAHADGGRAGREERRRRAEST